MGKSFSGTGPTQAGSTSPLSGEQLSLLNQIIGQAGGQVGQVDISMNPAYQQAIGSLGQFLQPDQQGLQNQFQSQFVEPSLQTFSQQIIPSIQSRFASQGAGRSSALNQTLAQAGENLQTQLSGQLAGLIDNQRNRQLQATGQLGSLAGLPSQQALSLLGLGLSPSQNAIIQPGQQGILGNIIGAGGQLASSALFRR